MSAVAWVSRMTSEAGRATAVVVIREEDGELREVPLVHVRGAQVAIDADGQAGLVTLTLAGVEVSVKP